MITKACVTMELLNDSQLHCLRDQLAVCVGDPCKSGTGHCWTGGLRPSPAPEFRSTDSSPAIPLEGDSTLAQVLCRQ